MTTDEEILKKTHPNVPFNQLSEQIKELMRLSRQAGWDDSAKMRKEFHCVKHGWACERCESCVEEARASSLGKCEKDGCKNTPNLCGEHLHEILQRARASERKSWNLATIPEVVQMIQEARADERRKCENRLTSHMELKALEKAKKACLSQTTQANSAPEKPVQSFIPAIWSETKPEKHKHRWIAETAISTPFCKMCGKDKPENACKKCGHIHENRNGYCYYVNQTDFCGCKGETKPEKKEKVKNNE